MAIKNLWSSWHLVAMCLEVLSFFSFTVGNSSSQGLCVNLGSQDMYKNVLTTKGSVGVSEKTEEAPLEVYKAKKQ